MSRSTRLTCVFVSAFLALSLGVGSTLPAQAEDTPDPRPARPAASSTTPQLAAPPVEHRVGTRPTGAVSEHKGIGSSRAVRSSGAGTTADSDPAAGPSVYGEVWESYSGDDVENIEVAIWPKSNIYSEPAATAITNSYGEYSLGILPPGDYVLKFSGDGYITQWWKAAESVWTATTITVVEGGQPIEANAEIDHSDTITGTVATAKGKPIVGWTVALLVWVKSGSYWGTVDAFATDSAGRFSFPNVRPGLYAVVGNYLPSDARLKAEAHYVSLMSYSGTRNGGVLEPWVVGAPGVGLVQKVDVGSGSWKKTTFSYQWLRDGVKIPKATKKTYTPVIADLYAKLQVRVTSRQGNNFFTVTSPTSWPMLRNSVPRIGGTLAVGAEATADAGVWETASVQSYQWYADGKAIAGATGSSLVLGAAQKGKKLTVTVTGKYYNFPAISRTSTSTAKVALTGMPTITGAAAVGTTLKAKPGTWTKKTKFSYQWLRNGTAIRKATKSSYKLTAADRGTSITIRVTGKLSGYATVAMISAALPIPA